MRTPPLMKLTISDYHIYEKWAWIKLLNCEDKIFLEFTPICSEYEIGGFGDDITYGIRIAIEDLNIYKIETSNKIITVPEEIFEYYPLNDELLEELTTVIENQIN